MDMENNYRIKGELNLWWIPLMTGIIGIGLGIWCLVSPTTSMPIFAYGFAGCLIAAGILNLAYSISNTKRHPGWGWSLALGLLEIGAGAWMFTLNEQMIIATFIYVIGIWILVVAINAFCESIMFASYSPVMMIFMFLLCIAAGVFAVIFLSSPIMGGIAVWLWIGLALITFGFYRLMFAFQARKIARIHQRH